MIVVNNIGSFYAGPQSVCAGKGTQRSGKSVYLKENVIDNYKKRRPADQPAERRFLLGLLRSCILFAV